MASQSLVQSKLSHEGKKKPRSRANEMCFPIPPVSCGQRHLRTVAQFLYLTVNLLQLVAIKPMEAHQLRLLLKQLVVE